MIHVPICHGYEPNLPGNFFEHYPFQFHTDDSFQFLPLTERLQWTRCGVYGTVQSTQQKRPCSDLQFDRIVRINEERANNATKHMNFKYLNHVQLKDRATHYMEKSSKAEFEVMRLQRDQSKKFQIGNA